MKKFISSLLVLSTLGIGVAAHAENCSVNSMCYYTLNNHSPRVIYFNLPKKHQYICVFKLVKPFNMKVDYRNVTTTPAGHGMQWWPAGTGTALTNAIAVSTETMSDPSGTLSVTFQGHDFLNSQKIAVDCEYTR